MQMNTETKKAYYC